MSIGPTTTEQEVKISLFGRTRYAVKATLKTYFERPAFYLFYSMLGITIIGLFFGMKFSWQYYLILIILAGLEIVLPIIKKNDHAEQPTV